MSGEWLYERRMIGFEGYYVLQVATSSWLVSHQSTLGRPACERHQLVGRDAVSEGAGTTRIV